MEKNVRYYLKEGYMRTVHPVIWTIRMLGGSFQSSKEQKQCAKAAIFDTSIGSNNVGDEIIVDYCGYWLGRLECDSMVKLPTHVRPDGAKLKQVKHYAYKFLCGTNCLYSDMTTQKLWKMGNPFSAYRNICLLGVGWNSYKKKKVNWVTKFFYRHYLDASKMHSVRDEYTKRKLESIGIKNVLNTACPTMWNLTEKFCREIPEKKSANVVTTLTDYSRDYENDKKMLEILLRNYETVYLWLQGVNDLEYLRKTGFLEKVIIVDRKLSEYDKILKKDDIEYVGTRLHAGIRALNYKKRTIIIAVDNRAVEISRDTNLNIIYRKEISVKLEEKINTEFPTRIILPEKNIMQWKAQFKGLHKE